MQFSWRCRRSFASPASNYHSMDPAVCEKLISTFLSLPGRIELPTSSVELRPMVSRVFQ